MNEKEKDVSNLFVNDSNFAFWSAVPNQLFEKFKSSSQGLTSEQAKENIIQYGPNIFKKKKKTNVLFLIFSQFKSPLILLLLFSAILSIFLGDSTDAIIIIIILLLSSLLGFWQEYQAANAMKKLLTIVQTIITILRDGNQQDIPVEGVVPGDIVLLSAGKAVPGDCLILESKDLYVNEATLTGETYAVEKIAGELPIDTPLNQRKNSLFMGTHIVSGTAKAIIVNTSNNTLFGQIYEHLRLRPPETDFELGIKHFGYLLLRVTISLLVFIFLFNIIFSRPFLEAFLFALALAVGLTPSLLPAIISATMARGAKRMANKKVIVKRLSSIENFGSMNILCCDKTGTLTEGNVQVYSTIDVYGNENQKIHLYAYLNSFYETGYRNPIDEAIRNYHQFDLSEFQKLDEVPYGFIRKRLSILISHNGKNIMITKGALANILDICTKVEVPKEKIITIEDIREKIDQKFEELNEKGYRVLGIAYKDIQSSQPIDRDSETDMIFMGFIVMFDPLKPQINETITQLSSLGVRLKIITGDNKFAALYTSKQLNLVNSRVITGSEIRKMSNEALMNVVNDVSIFAEIEPNQKERIILALKKRRHVIGYMGDGINDASALHAADVGISVEDAVDVAKEAADIVLLEKDLDVLSEGVKEGRKTFANTLKYIFITTSANFGNMFSMAGASLFLPFLPMLPNQILLTNLISDIPAMTIATDSVDTEMIEKPQKWDIKIIRNFMIIFGLISSIFDFLAFFILLFFLNSSPVQFRTSWFIISIVTEILILLIIRTHKQVLKSKPSKALIITSLLSAIITIILPYSLLYSFLGFTPLNGYFIIAIAIIIISYGIISEITKRYFFKKQNL